MAVAPRPYLPPLPADAAVPAFHPLDPTADAPFLKVGAADPLTRVAFRPTNHVARCATCGLVSLRETWEALGGCPNGHTTMAAWDPRAAAAPMAPAAAVRPAAYAGDGAVGAPPPPPGSSRKIPGWVLPVALLALLGGVALAYVLTRDEPEPDAPVTADTPTAPTAVELDLGEVEGRLEDADFKGADGRFRDLYTFEADSSGRLLSFTLTSSAFAPDLVVETPDGQRVEGTMLPPARIDGGVTDERRVVIRDLRGPGVYRVTVTSRMPDAIGRYTLSLREDEAVRTLTAGAAALQAELGRTSVLAGGFHRDTYRFSGVAGREHEIRVTSGAFAPTIVVSGPGGAPVAGELARSGTGATLTFRPASSGTHTVVVSSRDRGATGAYLVGLTVEAAPPPAPTTPRADDSADGLRPGAASGDSLAPGATRTFPLTGRVGDRVVVEVRADGFTPSLVLIGPSGVVERASGDGDRARIRATLPSAGRYRVEVSGSGPGRFSVSMDRTEAPTSDRIPRLPGQGLPAPTPPAPDPPPTEGGETYQPQPIGGSQP